MVLVGGASTWGADAQPHASTARGSIARSLRGAESTTAARSVQRGAASPAPPALAVHDTLATPRRVALLGLLAVFATGADCGSDYREPEAGAGVQHLLVGVEKPGAYDYTITIDAKSPRSVTTPWSQLWIGFDDMPARADPLTATLACPGAEVESVKLDLRWPHDRSKSVSEVVREIPSTVSCGLHLETTPDFSVPFGLEWGVSVEVGIPESLEGQVEVSMDVAGVPP